MAARFPTVKTQKQSELTNRRIVRKYTAQSATQMTEKGNSAMSKNMGKPWNAIRSEQPGTGR